MKVLIPLCAVALVLGASTALADEESNSPTTAVYSPTSHDVDMLAVIAAVSKRTHRKFLIDPRVRASVIMLGADAREATFPMLQSILAVHGFTTYEREGMVVVVPDSNARQFAPGAGVLDAAHAGDDEVVTAVIEVKNISAPQLVPVLRPLMPQNAHLSSVIGRQALIIVDRAANVRRLTALIKELEKLPAAKPEPSSQ